MTRGPSRARIPALLAPCHTRPLLSPPNAERVPWMLNQGHPTSSHSRCAFLVASTVGYAGLRFGAPALAAANTAVAPQPGKAKSTILFFLCGGSSHLDMWDLKPEAPLEYRGLFQPINTTAPGVQISEHLPLTAKQAHHLAIVRSVRSSVNTNDHHAGYYYNLTGHAADPTFLSLGNNRTPMPNDWPYMGCVVGSRTASRGGLPNTVTLPHMPSRLPYTRPGQFAARLGVEHDPLYVLGSLNEPLKFEAPALVLAGDVNTARPTSRSSARHAQQCPARTSTRKLEGGNGRSCRSAPFPC